MAKERPFWLVWGEGKAPPAFKHLTVESAILEAERLARIHRGARFVVLRAITARSVEDVVRTDFGDDDGEIPF